MKARIDVLVSEGFFYAFGNHPQTSGDHHGDCTRRTAALDPACRGLTTKPKGHRHDNDVGNPAAPNRAWL